MTKSAERHTSEELALLIAYLQLVGIWFAIPSVTLLLNKDERYPQACGALLLLVIFLYIAYTLRWRTLFPQSASLIALEPYYADYDKVKWCRYSDKSDYEEPDY